MADYRYVLLDWDGNLAKTLDVWLHAVRTTMEKRGIRPTDTEIGRSFGQPVEHFTQWGVTDIEAAITEMDALAAAKMPEIELYPDALEVLEALKKRGKKLALITSSLRVHVAKVLDKHSMQHYFDTLVTYEDTTHHKPHPEPIEKALERLGGTKDRAVMIGDSDKDMGVGLNAGVDTVLFYPEAHQKFYDLTELKKLKPTFIVDDFREVLQIVQ